MAAAHVLKARWMYGDAGTDLLGHRIARLDPLRWSKNMNIEQLALDLEGNCINRGRPIRVRVKNRQDDAHHQKRSHAVVEQVFVNAPVAASALHDLSRCLMLKSDESPCHPDAPLLSQQQVDEEDDSIVGCDSFYSCATGWTQGSIILEGSVHMANDLQESNAENIPMSVLRAHVTSGQPLQVRWMWGDAGLAALLPQTAWLVETNPWRWSMALSLDEASRQLEEQESSQDAARPVRLQVSSPSGEGALHVSFATTASNMAVAESVLWEIQQWVHAFGSQELRQLSCDSFHSFAHVSLAASRPSISRSFSFASCPSLQPSLQGSRHSLLPSCRRTLRPKLPPSNANRVSQYRWLSELLESITCGSAGSLSEDLGTGERATPLFVVAGFCPNAIAGMQAVLFCQFDERKVIDFWWVKPQTGSPNILEQNTLHLHSAGRFKNVPGKSRAVYAPLAEKFSGCTDKGHFYFGVEGGRAFIEKRVDESGETGRRMLIYFVWQESWSSLFSSKKFVQGKMCYQRCEPGSQPLTGDQARFFARQYRIESGRLEIAEEEEEVPSMMPPDHFQEMFDMSE